jgi:membrane protein YqaA with SNARE-associated domain
LGGGFAERLVRELGTPRQARKAFFWIGAADGSFLPVPAEPFVFPVMAAHVRRAPMMAMAMLAGCLVGCFAFYLIAMAAGEAIVEPLMQAFGMAKTYERHLAELRDNAFLTLLIIGFTPIPLQIGTIGAGVVGVDPATFLAAMALSRGARYGLVALAAMALGQRGQEFFVRHFWAVTLGLLALAGAVVLVFDQFGF